MWSVQTPAWNRGPVAASCHWWLGPVGVSTGRLAVIDSDLAPADSAGGLGGGDPHGADVLDRLIEAGGQRLPIRGGPGKRVHASELAVGGPDPDFVDRVPGLLLGGDELDGGHRTRLRQVDLDPGWGALGHEAGRLDLAVYHLGRAGGAAFDPDRAACRQVAGAHVQQDALLAVVGQLLRPGL